MTWFACYLAFTLLLAGLTWYPCRCKPVDTECSLCDADTRPENLSVTFSGIHGVDYVWMEPTACSTGCLWFNRTFILSWDGSWPGVCKWTTRGETDCVGSDNPIVYEVSGQLYRISTGMGGFVTAMSIAVGMNLLLGDGRTASTTITFLKLLGDVASVDCSASYTTGFTRGIQSGILQLCNTSMSTEARWN